MNDSKEGTKIDYKNRLKGAFDAILTIIDINKKDSLKTIKRIAFAQLKNIEGVQNKDNA